MENKINSTQRRAEQYWFSDGLAELMGGALCLLLAIYFAAQQILSASPGTFAFFFFIIFILAFGIRRLMLWYREHSTYRHTGYIELKKGWENRKLLGISIGFSLLLLGFMIYTILRGIQTVEATPAIGGFIFAFVYALAGYETKLVRFTYLAIFCLVMGVALAFSGLNGWWGVAVLCLFTSLVLFAYGAVTRVVYLRMLKVTPEQAHEE